MLYLCVACHLLIDDYNYCIFVCIYIKSDVQIPTAEGPDPVGRNVHVLALFTHMHAHFVPSSKTSAVDQWQI